MVVSCDQSQGFPLLLSVARKKRFRKSLQFIEIASDHLPIFCNMQSTFARKYQAFLGFRTGNPVSLRGFP